VITTTLGLLTTGSFGTAANTFCQGNDSRLSDARTPTAHTHAASDIASGTIAAARLGTGTADSTTFLRGDGTWQVGTGGSGSGISVSDADVRYLNTTGDTATGNIGFGVTPSFPVHIGGSTALAPVNLYIDPSAHATSRRASLAIDQWQLSQDTGGTGTKDFGIYSVSAGTYALSINTSAFVGIGLRVPSFPLHIGAQPGSGTTSLFIAPSSDATSERAAMQIDNWVIAQDTGASGTKNFGIYSTAAAAWRMVVDTSGNVAIGGTVPTQKLHINDTTTSPYIQFTAANTAFCGINFGDTDRATSGRVQYSHQFDVLQFFVDGSERARIANVAFYVYPAGSVSQPCIANGNDGGTGLWFPATGTIAVSANGVERLRVGTGVTITGAASATAFAVSGAGDANLQIDYLGGGNNLHDATQHVFRTLDGARDLASIGTRTVFMGNGESVVLGARYSVTGGTVYFGATDATSTPGMQISNNAGTALISCTNAGAVSIPGSLSVAGNAVVVTTDSRLTDSRSPTAHTHGNITNAGAIGSTSGQIVVTGASGVLTTAATIASSSVSGLSAVATSGSYNDLTNKPSASGPTFGAILALS
jgi:hypothetical protein